MARKRSLGGRLARIVSAIVLALTMLIALAFWCESDRAPQAVERLYDRLMQVAFGFDPLTRCTEIRPNVRSADLRSCYELGDRRRFKGIYINEYEGERFVENSGPSKIYRPSDHVTFMMDYRTDISAAPSLAIDVGLNSRIFHVVVEGRKARLPARSGYTGIGDEILFVDQVLSAELVQTFPGYVPDDVLIR